LCSWIDRFLIKHEELALASFTDLIEQLRRANPAIIEIQKAREDIAGTVERLRSEMQGLRSQIDEKVSASHQELQSEQRKLEAMQTRIENIMAEQDRLSQRIFEQLSKPVTFEDL
jgi:uncharacterized coiled-coil DUF342 family protein